jgi:hypothetical protein
MNKQANLEILDIISKAVSHYPEMTFSEILVQLNLESTDDGKFFNEDSSNILGRVFKSFLYDQIQDMPFNPPHSSKGVY